MNYSAKAAMAVNKGNRRKLSKRKSRRVELRIFAAFSLMLLASCGDDSPLTIDDYDDIPRLLEHQKIPGISIAVIKDFAIDKVLVYGFSDQGSDVPVSKDTLFQAGAISQSLTAAAALKVYQDAGLDPDSDINNQLSTWQLDAGGYTSKQKATLRKLLSHMAGTNVPGYDGYQQGETLPTLKEVLTNTGNSRAAGVIVNSDSDVYRYSSGGYSVVQQALIDVAKKPFDTIMADTIFTPLQMSNSTFTQPPTKALRASASAGHDSQGQVVSGRYYNYPEMAASGLWSTAEDLAKFVIELQTAFNGESGIGLSNETAVQLLEPVFMNYGLGLDIKNKGQSVYFGSGGTTKGFQAVIQAHKTTGVGVVIMTNSDNGFEAITKVLKFVAEEEKWPDY